MANTVKVGITATDEGFKSTMDQMKQSANSFGSSLDSAGKKTQTLNGAFRAARKEASDLALAYHQLDDAAKNSDFGRQMKAQLDQAMQAAGELADLKGDVAAEISNIASDTMAWDAAAQGIGVVSSGLQGLASAYGLLGGDVQAFTQALVAVNAVQSVANTIIGIGNALQKQSALMVGLRAAKTALFGTTEAAATVAETANTTATTANTTATVANTAAKGANAAANVGQTAATTAATTAQLANNAAVLANPYVLAAAAVVALTGAIVAWYVSMDDATDEQLALNAATEAFEAELDSSMKTAAEQISTFNSLKKVYDECGGNVDVLKKKIIDNTEAQRKLGVTVKTVDDVHRLFGKNSKNYIEYAYARAKAAAAEAAQYAILGEVLTELTRIQAKMMRGEEVDYVDFKKILNKAGLSDTKINKLVEEAGGKIEWDYIWSNLNDSSMDWSKFMSNAIDAINTEGVGKHLQKMIQDNMSTADAATADFGDLLEANNKKIKAGSDGHKKNAAAAKKTTEEINKTLHSLEGCDALISDAEKEMKKLDNTATDYSEKMQKLKNVILTARVAKLGLIDKTSVEGLSQAKSLIEQIMKSLPEGSDFMKDMQKELSDVNNKLYGMYAVLAQDGDIKSLKNARTQVDAIIETLPEGSDELRTWINIWKQINDKILESDQKIKDLKDGLQQGSKTWIEREIKKIQTEIDKLDPNIDGNMSIKAALELNKQELQFQLNKLEKDSSVTIVADLKLNELDRSYKMTALEQLSHQFDKLKEKRDELTKSLEKAVSSEEYDKISNSISGIDAEMTKLKKKMNFQELTDDIKSYTKELNSASLETTKGFVDGLHTIYNVITDLPDKLNECKDGFEGFFEIMDAGFSLIDSITSFIENIKKLTEFITLLSGAKEALASANVIQAQSTQQETAAEEQNTAATLSSAAADVTAATASMTKAGANTAEASTEAAAQNSKMGPYGWIIGIAAALAVAGALFGILGQAKGFASGGIIQGKTTMGDQILARVNAGEMVLNKKQQANLFNLLDHGSNNGSDTPLQVSTIRVKGSDLYLALSNYSKITGKTL